MNDSVWADGYVVDIDYTDGYYRELAPGLLRFVTLLAGMQRNEAPDGFNYCELGCGNGRSVVLHAAAEPRGRFHGVDFNPKHIQHARKLAQDAGTANAVFLEASFASLRDSTLPEMDFITLHGVHSWVSPENRRHIAEFIRARLKPGGLVYMSYNCLPGLAPIMPLQRLIMGHAAGGSGDLAGRMRAALDYAARLDQAGAGYFQANPAARLRLASLGTHDPAYLAHEYFNENWLPAWHVDVCAEMAAAQVVYIGSATLVENFEPFALKPELTRLVAEVTDPVLAETVKDFVRNTGFRRDVFARAPARAAMPDLEAALDAQRFSLARPRAICHLGARVPAGDVTLQAELHNPVLDALARTPMRFDELAIAPETMHLKRVQLRQAVFGLAAVGNVLPALPAEAEAQCRATTARFNKAVLEGPAGGANIYLASPVWGVGVALNPIDRFLLQGPRTRSQAVELALKAFLNSGIKMKSGDKPVESVQDARTMIDRRAAEFFGHLLPFFRQIGIAD